MNIVVLVKQVPDTTEIKIDKVNGTLIRNGIPSIINPDDQAAIECALKLKERYDAQVTILTMGPMQAVKMQREILAMGADEAILVTDRKFAGADTKATSYTIATQLSKMEYDLVIAGRQAIDGDTAQVGPQVAEILNIPQVTYVDQILNIESNKIKVRKSLEESYEIIEAKLPALITTLSEMNTLRYPRIDKIVEAHQKEIQIVTTEDLDIDLAKIGLNGSPTKVKKTYTKEISMNAEVHELEPKKASELLINILKEKQYI